MSFQKKDRSFQSKTGRTFHPPGAYAGMSFAEVIAAALKAEWGGSPSARKELGRITNANERAVRNWLDGRNSPSGEHLVSLIEHSDAVFEAVLHLTDRYYLAPSAELLELRQRLVAAVETIDGLAW